MNATYHVTYLFPRWMASPDVQNRSRTGLNVRISAGMFEGASGREAIAAARRSLCIPRIAAGVRAVKA